MGTYSFWLNGQDIVIGGTDTTSTTILWAMADLLSHPQEMTNAQDELRTVVGAKNDVEHPQIILSSCNYEGGIKITPSCTTITAT